jgi:hypothetical protein
VGNSNLYVAFLLLLGGSIGFCAASEPGPAPPLTISEVSDLGVVFSPPPVSGRDGGYSARFDDRSVWVFGDTLFEDAGAYLSPFHSNTWSWTGDLDASNGIASFEQSFGLDGLPLLLLPFTDQEKMFNDAHASDHCKTAPCGVRWALWPGAVVADPVYHRLLLFYEKVFIGLGEMNFTKYGSSVTIWAHPEDPPQRMRFSPPSDNPTLLFQDGEPCFGDAAVVMGHQLYVYGCERQGTLIPCRLARVDLDHVFEKEHWQTWTADGKWSTNLNLGRALFNGNEILSVSYNHYLGCFLAVYSQPMSTTVMLRTALQPEGPWSSPLDVFNTLAAVNDIGWTYDALEHSEYSRENGQVLYITYSRQTSANAFEFRLVSVRIKRVH